MQKLPKPVVVGMGLAVLVACLTFVATTVYSQPPEAKDAVAEPAAPADQTYIGVKKCSACHFKQYTNWKKTKHAKEAWESVPAKYRTNGECLACHTTGYGAATGFKDEASSANLVGTTCEGCHGPGSKHEEACKPFLNEKKLEPAEEKIARDSIWKIQPRNVCAACHSSKGHIDHPKYDK